MKKLRCIDDTHSKSLEWGNIYTTIKDSHSNELENFYKLNRFQEIGEDGQAIDESVSLQKQYKTKNGDEVKLDLIIPDRVNPVVGAVCYSGVWRNHVWDIYGKHPSLISLDLVEIPKIVPFKNAYLDTANNTVYVTRGSFTIDEFLKIAEGIKKYI